MARNWSHMTCSPQPVIRDRLAGVGMRLDHVVSSRSLLDPTSATRITSIENRWRDGTSDHSGLKVSYQQKPVEAAGAVARKEKKTYTFARELGHVTKKALAALANVLLLTTLAISITSASADQLAAGPSAPAPQTTLGPGWPGGRLPPPSISNPEQSFFSEATGEIGQHHGGLASCDRCSFCSLEEAPSVYNDHESGTT